MTGIKRNPVMELSDFLSKTGHVEAELYGFVKGLTEYQLPNGTISYAGVLSSQGKAVLFQEYTRLNLKGKDIEKRIDDAIQTLAVLRYSVETGDPIALGVGHSPFEEGQIESVVVRYAALSPATPSQTE